MASPLTLLRREPATSKYHEGMQRSNAVGWPEPNRPLRRLALTVVQGKYFEVRYFLNIVVSSTRS